MYVASEVSYTSSSANKQLDLLAHVQGYKFDASSQTVASCMTLSIRENSLLSRHQTQTTSGSRHDAHSRVLAIVPCMTDSFLPCVSSPTQPPPPPDPHTNPHAPPPVRSHTLQCSTVLPNTHVVMVRQGASQLAKEVETNASKTHADDHT